LCFWLVERHDHGWLRHIDRAKIFLGSGKRVLAKGRQARFDLSDHGAG